mgnify:CR=1 FL=1
MSNQDEWIKNLCAGIAEWFAPDEPKTSLPLPGMERHAVTESFFTLSGECPYSMNGEFRILHPRSCCLIRPWVPHPFGFLPGTPAGCEQLWFHFRSDHCPCAVIRSQDNGQYVVLMHFELPDIFCPVYRHVIAEPDPGGEKVHYFYELILREAASAVQNPVSGTLRNDDLADAVRAFIRARNGVNCTMDRLERTFCYSRSHLFHIFRQRHGMSIGQWIDCVRIEFMQELLQHGLKQKEIAAELGFGSASAFWLWRDRLRKHGRLP